MNYKIVTNNAKLLQKAQVVLKVLDMKEAIHIQDVDFWLIDASTIEKTSLLSYKNKQAYSKVLFVVNDIEEIKLCLENSFSNYIKNDFKSEELKLWCKFLLKRNEEKTITLEDESKIDFKNSIIIKNLKKIKLTKQEAHLLLNLKKGEFVSTKNLSSLLNLNSQTSVRTIINRLRKKTSEDFISQKRDYGYKLNLKNEKTKNENLEYFIKELEEQNLLMQEIIDSSPIFIATFIHKQLFCINKAFREYLGSEIIKELWSEEKGDFFQLIKHNLKQKDELKQEIFNARNLEVELYDLDKSLNQKFEIESFYFSNLDKHLLIFKPNKVTF